MNKERELLRRIHYCWVGVDALEDESDPEIKALNEVMREAEHYLFHEPKEPEDEPVAWLNGVSICPELGYDYTITEHHPKDLGWTPLYTRPEPERKPMTMEEIRKLGESFRNNRNPEKFIDFARAIEKHHGIGGEE